MTQERAPAIVLLSGGLDSATALAIAQREGFDVYAISYRYGQRHAIELEAAERVARRAGVTRHIIADVDLRAIGGSSLTSEMPVPRDRDPGEMDRGIPSTYVPARNTIFLSYALAWAEVLGAHHIYIGVNALDYSGYPDCRPEYIAAFERMANLATREGVEGRCRLRICAPLIAMSKADIIRVGHSLGVDYSITTSCYDPSLDGAACGRCDACQLRLKGFREAGVPDPAPYATVAAR